MSTSGQVDGLQEGCELTRRFLDVHCLCLLQCILEGLEHPVPHLWPRFVERNLDARSELLLQIALGNPNKALISEELKPRFGETTKSMRDSHLWR